MLSVMIIVAAALLGVIQCAPFDVTLSIPKHHLLGQEVICGVTLTNTQNEDFYLFTRNTPLEGFKSEIFTVTRNGKKVHYDGLLFKQKPVNKNSEGVLVPAMGSVSENVDLSMVYSINEPGTYSVALTSEIFYQIKPGKNISRQLLKSLSISFDVLLENDSRPKLTVGEKLRLEQANVKLVKNSTTAKDPLFAGSGDTVDKDTAKLVWEAAYQMVVASPAVVDKGDDKFVKWFGAKDEGHMDTVKGVFQSIQKSMEDEVYTLYFKGQECKRNDFAYTFFRSNYIYLCNGYFRAEDIHDYNSKLGTFVHQLTHAVADTQDFPLIDTPEECQNLAMDVPLNAIRSAYNYEYFCETES